MEDPDVLREEEEALEEEEPNPESDHVSVPSGAGNAPGLRPEDVTEEEERRPPLPVQEEEPSPELDRTAPGVIGGCRSTH